LRIADCPEGSGWIEFLRVSGKDGARIEATLLASANRKCTPEAEKRAGIMAGKRQIQQRSPVSREVEICVMVLDYGFEGNVDNGLQAIEFLGASRLFGWRKYGDLRMFGLREGMFCWKAEFFDICRFITTCPACPSSSTVQTA